MDTDVLVVGGGIAGLSAAAWLAQECDVVVIEAEPTLGYHTTGRSAATYTECYGSFTIPRLAQISKPFLTDIGATRPMPILFVAAPDGGGELDNVYDRFSPIVPSLRRLTPMEISEMCAAITPDLTAGGVLEPGGMDIDVHLLQTTFTSMVRDGGGTIRRSAALEQAVRMGDRWRVDTTDGEISARMIVDAAGAWGDVVAERCGVTPLGLTPMLRSVFVFATDLETDGWPLAVDTGERWYFRPEGPNVLASAASEIPSPPCDARAPEIDIALGIERINTATVFAVRSVQSTWAGLRTFTPDRTPGIGFDPTAEGFLWVVGQGGYGIKTSPAIGEMVAALALGKEMPTRHAAGGINPEWFDPARFRSATPPFRLAR